MPDALKESHSPQKQKRKLHDNEHDVYRLCARSFLRRHVTPPKQLLNEKKKKYFKRRHHE